MVRRLGLTLMLLVLVTSALTGCGGAEAEPTAAPAPTNTTAAVAATATPVPPTNTPMPAPTDTPAPAQAADTATPEPASSGEEQEPAGEAAEDLKWSPSQLFAQEYDIDSYRTTMNFAVSGAAFEGESDLSFVILGEYVRDPEAQRMVMTMGEEVFMEMVQIGDQSWMNYAGMWMETTGEDTEDITESLMLFDMEDIGDLGEFEKVGSETINGIKTTHYHFTEENLFKVLQGQDELGELEGLDSAAGDIWVNDDGVVMKWVMSFEGVGINEELPDAKGAMDVTYELHDINASDIDIQPPASLTSAETLGFEMPVPEGATQTMAMEGMITYDVVDTTIADLTDFYKTAFADIGFTYDGESSMTSEDYASLTFSDGSVTLSVSIFTGEEGVVQVMVMTETGE